MQQRTDAPPDQGSTPPDSAFGRRVALAIVRTAAACMAGWSLYVVARHYDVPWQLAIGASLVFDGVAYLALRMATDAMRAGRSAAAPIAATLAMAGVSVYLNLVHARFTGGGRPAEVLYASPAVALLLVSVLSWAAERAAARAERGETPMRLPAFGLLGWTLAREEAMAALKAKAVEHVTSGASRPRTVLSERFAATPTARLDRIPTPESTPLPRPATAPAELTKADLMRHEATPDMPQVSGLPLSEAIPAIHRRLTDDVSPRAVVQHLALQGMATDTAYVRTALSRARTRAAEEAVKEDARRAQAATAPGPEQGTGGYL